MDKIKTLTLADAIRVAVARSGLTLIEIGEALDIDPKTISRWQLGRNTPRFDHLVMLAELTGYDVGFFADTVTDELRTRPGVHTLSLFDADGAPCVHTALIAA